MRSIPISLSLHRALLVLCATLASALLAAALLSSAPASGRAPHGSHRHERTARVKISDFAFHPHTLRVRRETKIVFVNGDSVAHTATRRGGFDTGPIVPHHSIAVRFRRAGVYAFHCAIHPFMHGRIVVR